MDMDHTELDIMEGGDEYDESTPVNYENFIVGTLIIALIVYLIYTWRAGFNAPVAVPLITSALPYTGGANLRYASADSSTNRKDFSQDVASPY